MTINVEKTEFDFIMESSEQFYNYISNFVKSHEVREITKKLFRVNKSVIKRVIKQLKKLGVTIKIITQKTKKIKGNK